MDWSPAMQEAMREAVRHQMAGGSLCLYADNGTLLAEATLDDGAVPSPEGATGQADGIPTTCTVLRRDGIPLGQGTVGAHGSGADCEMRVPRVLRGGAVTFEAARWKDEA